MESSLMAETEAAEAGAASAAALACMEYGREAALSAVVSRAAALANAVDLPDRLRLRATFLTVTAAASACALAAAEAKRRAAVSGAGKGCALGPNRDGEPPDL